MIKLFLEVPPNTFNLFLSKNPQISKFYRIAQYNLKMTDIPTPLLRIFEINLKITVTK